MLACSPETSAFVHMALAEEWRDMEVQLLGAYPSGDMHGGSVIVADDPTIRADLASRLPWCLLIDWPRDRIEIRSSTPWRFRGVQITADKFCAAVLWIEMRLLDRELLRRLEQLGSALGTAVVAFVRLLVYRGAELATASAGSRDPPRSRL